MQVCRFDRGSVCQIPDLQLDSAEFLHYNAAPTTDSLRNGLQSAVTCSSKLITECVPPSLLAPAQQVRTEQSRVPFIHSRDGLLTGASRAQKFIDLVQRLRSTRLRSHFTR